MRRRIMGGGGGGPYRQLTYTRGIAATGFTAGALTNDGRIVLPPRFHDIGIYNPADNTLSTVSHPYDNNKFNGAVKINDGRIVLCPYNYHVVGLFNPANNTYTDGVSTGISITDQFSEPGQLLGNGKVLFAPYAHGYIGLYDPASNTYANGPALSGAGGSAPLPGGNALIIPYTNTTFYVYNYASNTLSNAVTHGEGTAGFYGNGVLLPDGKVIFPPQKSKYIGIYDSTNNTYKRGAAYERGLYFNQCARLADGTVLFASRVEIGIYDPEYDEYIPGPKHGENSDWANIVPLPDGRAILVPNLGSYIGIVS